MCDIKKIIPEKNDIITVTVKEPLSSGELQDLLIKLETVFPNNTVVIMPPSIDIEACDSSDLDEAINKLIEVRDSRAR